MKGQLISSRNLKSRVMEKGSPIIITTIRFWDTHAITIQLISATSHALQLDLMTLRGLFKP